MSSNQSQLSRTMSLTGLTATGICSMLGASIYVVPFMVQRNVPGIGPYVLPAFVLAAIPALLAALAYAIMASCMPRAGGSYLYASRGLHPYLGFAASFSQWFGLSIAIGVVSYVIIPFFRDIAASLGYESIANLFNDETIRLCLSIGLLWLFVGINVLGIKAYERTLIPLMVLMFVLGSIVIVFGFTIGQQEFGLSLKEAFGTSTPAEASEFSFFTLVSASAVLFSSFIGFDSIAQAGGEARNPGRNLPLAIGMAFGTVGLFYMLFTAAVYHTVPWQYVAEQARVNDTSAAGLMGIVLSPGWTVTIVAGAAVALTNDLPAMLLSVSRLMFAWAEDGIFPKVVAGVHPRYHTPLPALLLSGGMATIGILGCHFAGDFFLGIDILVISMLVNFLCICLAVITLKTRNPILYASIAVIRRRWLQQTIAICGVLSLGSLLVIQVYKDLTSTTAWYYHSTIIWLMVMGLATGIFINEFRNLRKSGVDDHKLFSNLPPD